MDETDVAVQVIVSQLAEITTFYKQTLQTESCLNMAILQSCDGNREEQWKPRAVRLVSILCSEALSSGVDYQ